MEAVGVDISDHAIKFVEFRQKDGVRELGLFGERPLPEGVIVAGELVKQDELVRELKTLKNETGFSLVRSCLTESRGYLFQTALKNVAPGEARAAIDFQLEEHVPIARAEAVFDAEPRECLRQLARALVRVAVGIAVQGARAVGGRTFDRARYDFGIAVVAGGVHEERRNQQRSVRDQAAQHGFSPV